MNKQQYMDELVSKLEVFGEDIKNEIVSDYEEHFRMGLDSGKSEDQICTELGSIDELVDELNKLTGKQNETAKAAEDKAESTADNNAERSGNAEKNDEDIKKALEDASEQFAKGLGEAMTSLAGFLGNMAATIAKNSEKWTSDISEKAGDWGSEFKNKAGDWGSDIKTKATDAADTIKTKAEEFKDNWNASETGRTIRTKADKGSEFARKAADEIGAFAKDVAAKSKAFAKEISASYRKTMNKEAGEAAASTDIDDEIDEIAREIAYDEADVLREQDTLDGDFDSIGDDDSVAATSGASAETADTVIIETDCAQVSVQGSDGDKVKFNYENNGTPNQRLAYGFDFRQEGRTIYAIAKKKPGTSNFFKSITCPDIELTIEVPENLKNLSIRSMSGDIDCEDISVEQFTISTMSGDIDMENCIFRALDASTMSGDISLEDGSASEIKMTTVSGDIEITNGRAENITFKTTSGDITVEDSKAANITASSVSGDIDLALAGVSGYLAHVKTTCGDITLEFDNELMEVTRGGSYVQGTGEVKLNLSTVSGAIGVEA